MKLVILFSLLFMTRLGLADVSSKKVVKFSVVESWSEPYAFFDSERNLNGGALKEIIEEIAKRMDVRAEHVHLSRNRVDEAMEKGNVDVRCYINESWVVKPDLYLFSEPIFLVSNSVIWKKGRSPLTKISDLHGKTLGSVSGYIYKSLDELFKSGKVKRSDVSNEAMNLTLIDKDRIDYAIVETASIKWSMANKNEQNLKSIEFFQFDLVPVKCGVLKKNVALFKPVGAVIEKMKRDGTLKAIAAKFSLKY